MENFPVPNVVDIAAFTVIALGSLLGIKRGLSGELARLLSIVTAFIFGIRFCNPFGAWLTERSRLDARSTYAFAFVATVVFSFALMLVLRFVLKRVMKVVVAEKFDKMAGLVAGFISSVFLVAIVLLGINLWPHDYLNRVFGSESILGRAVVRAMPAVREEFKERKLPVPGQKEKDR